ncbi:MAG TPA: hypothetical protein DIW31_10955 [Bacteroidales bacterium]|nr:hypothetical protein [Bacteroidales bacterium]
MKRLIKLSSLLLVMVLGLTINSTAQSRAQKKADKDTDDFVYEIEGMSVGTQGTYLIKVWSYSKKPTIAINQAKKNAVHGVIFKGFSGKPGVPGQKALATPEIEKEKEAWFDEFFSDKGNYNRYVTESGDGTVAAEDRMKVGKKYKIGVIVSVNVADLRKALEDAGVIKGLSSGF